jgi:hypothetical protein
MKFEFIVRRRSKRAYYRQKWGPKEKGKTGISLRRNAKI